MKKLRVGLVGYYGWGNYGDEFFKDVLETHLQDCSIRVLHDMGPKGELILDNLKANVEEVDVVMIGGGDLVIPFSFSQLYWHEAFLAKPVVIYGVGVPKWGGNDPTVIEKMRKFFQHRSVKKITARDQESAEWISEFLKPKAPVVCAPDIVCAYRHAPVATLEGTFGLVLRHQPNGLNQENTRALLDAVRARGYKARVLMLGTGRTLADDFQTVSRMDLGDCDIVVRDTLDALTEELIACDRVASMKFHGCVMAMTHGVPCLSLSAANKFRNFYTELGKRPWVSSLVDAQLGAKLEAFLDAPRMTFPESIREHARQGLATLQQDLEAAATGAPSLFDGLRARFRLRR